MQLGKILLKASIHTSFVFLAVALEFLHLIFSCGSFYGSYKEVALRVILKFSAKVLINQGLT